MAGGDSAGATKKVSFVPAGVIKLVRRSPGCIPAISKGQLTLNHLSLPQVESMLVMSGGEGYIDFRIGK